MPRATPGQEPFATRRQRTNLVFRSGRHDNDEQAQEYLTTARAMYGEMGMTHWLALGYKLADRHHGKTGLRDQFLGEVWGNERG